MNKTKTIISLATAPVITGAFLASAMLSPVAATEDVTCDRETDLQGTVSRNEATVTNNATNESCTYDATLAVYESPKQPETYGWIEAQKRIGSKTVSVKAGETVSINVDYSSSACYFQSDLIRGNEVLDVPYYRNAMDVDVWSQSCNTTTNNTTNNNETNNNTTNNNTTNNNTTNNNVSNSVGGQLASTGDVLTVIGFLVAGAIALISGIFLRKAGK